MLRQPLLWLHCIPRNMCTSSVQKGLRRLCEIAYGYHDCPAQKYIPIVEMYVESTYRQEQYLIPQHKHTGDITFCGSA